MQSNNGFREHIRYIKKKARIAMGAVWGLGERYWKGDIRARWKLFRALIEAIMTYGAEIWGWEEQGELQKIITKYWRWVLGFNWDVPSYIVQEEVDEAQLWAKTWRRAYKYERRLRQEEKEDLTNVCAKWRNEEGRKGLRWRIEKRKQLGKLGISEVGIQDMESRGWQVEEEIERRIKDRRGSENRQKMKNSKYNPIYKVLKQGQGRAQYLTSGVVHYKEKKMLARYRTGMEMGAVKY